MTYSYLYIITKIYDIFYGDIPILMLYSFKIFNSNIIFLLLCIVFIHYSEGVKILFILQIYRFFQNFNFYSFNGIYQIISILWKYSVLKMQLLLEEFFDNGHLPHYSIINSMSIWFCGSAQHQIPEKGLFTNTSISKTSK